MTTKSRKQSKTDSVEGRLRAEIKALRVELDEAQAAIEFRDHRARELSKMLKLGIWEWDEIENKANFYSNEMAAVYGADVEEFKNEFRTQADFERIVHPDDLAYFRERIDGRNLEPGVSSRFDYRIVDSQGEIRHLREFIQGVFDDRDTLIASFGMVQDITESQAAITALQESEQRYHSLFEQMPLGVQEEDYSPFKKSRR